MILNVMQVQISLSNINTVVLINTSYKYKYLRYYINYAFYLIVGDAS